MHECEQLEPDEDGTMTQCEARCHQVCQPPHRRMVPPPRGGIPDRAERSIDSGSGYLARALGTALEGQTKVFGKLGEQAGDARMKIVGACPKLTASSADALRKELKSFYNYVNDARVKDRGQVL